MGNDASENLMRAVEVEKLVANARVGESGDRSVRDEKAFQQAERKDSVTQKVSEVRKEIGRSPDDDEVISTLRKAIEDFRKKTIQEVIHFTSMTC